MYEDVVLYPNEALIQREGELNLLLTLPRSSHPLRFSE